MDIMELYNKKEPFTKEEYNFVKKYLTPKRSSYKCYYAFYRKKSKYPIMFIIDSDYFAPRKSGVMNHWEIICTRDISDIEFEEIIQNFGCNNRRFQSWNYNSPLMVQNEDMKYNVKTPEAFLVECNERGFSEGFQSKLDFNDYENIIN